MKGHTSPWEIKRQNNMQHNLKKDYRVGDWMDSPLKCVLGLFKNRKATISDCPPFHFSSAGLSMVARLPQQTTSLSTQQQQISRPFTIFTTCLFFQPLTPSPYHRLLASPNCYCSHPQNFHWCKK
jgi:hypothetical protein